MANHDHLTHGKDETLNRVRVHAIHPETALLLLRNAPPGILKREQANLLWKINCHFRATIPAGIDSWPAVMDSWPAGQGYIDSWPAVINSWLPTPSPHSVLAQAKNISQCIYSMPNTRVHACIIMHYSTVIR